MTENQDMLQRLEELLSQKKSKKFYAEKLGISEFEVTELLKEIREKDLNPQLNPVYADISICRQ